ncbi:hypothetical protein ACIGW8_20295 [Streptomyces sioyaensis]|uniref:hypothetical protein n=1 Tax=Streptomyces sioyaensis TaxID=67364 RepID=UPI0037CCE33C
MDCPHVGGEPGQPACALFAGHDGPCTFAFDATPAADVTRIHRIGKALKVLTQHAHHEHPAVWDAAQDATLLTWDELRACRIWDRLTECDQAAVFRVVSHASVPWNGKCRAATLDRLARDATEVARLWSEPGQTALQGGAEAVRLWETLTGLPQEWQAVVVGEQRASSNRPFGKSVQAAAAQAAAGQAPGEPGTRGRSYWDELDDQKVGAEEAVRMARLPYGWQVDLVRRAALGLENLCTSSAAMAINRLSSYGIHIPRHSEGSPTR